MLLDVLLALLLLAVIAGAALWLTRHRRAAADSWRVRIRSGQRGTLVELVRGCDPPQRVALLDPAAEDFSTQLEEARAAAMERATALNVARQGLPR